MEFGYWGIKGLAEPIRLIAAYTGVELKEHNPASREAWGVEKAAFGAPFANLPYLVDGDFKVTESSAIPVYLAHKAGRTDLLGEGHQEQAQVRQIEGILNDVRANIFKIIMLKEGHKAAYEETFKVDGQVAQKIDQLSKFLGDKEFFFGHVTLVDFYYAFYSRFYQASAFAAEVDTPFAKYDNLKKLVATVEALTGVKDLVEKRRQVPYMPPGVLALPVPTDAEVLKL